MRARGAVVALWWCGMRRLHCARARECCGLRANIRILSLTNIIILNRIILNLILHLTILSIIILQLSILKSPSSK